MLWLGEKEIAKEKFYASKKPIKIWDVNVDNIVFSKFVETKIYMYLIAIKFDKAVRPLVLIKSNMSWYVKTLKIEYKNSKLMSYCIDDEKLLQKDKAIWTKTEDFKNIELYDFQSMMIDI